MESADFELANVVTPTSSSRDGDTDPRQLLLWQYDIVISDFPRCSFAYVVWSHVEVLDVVVNSLFGETDFRFNNTSGATAGRIEY